MRWVLVLIIYGTPMYTGGPSISTVPHYTEQGCYAAAEAFEQAKPAKFPASWIKRVAFCIPGPDVLPPDDAGHVNR